jgi:cytoskeletal protein CcmA (bactofilin family)
MFGKRKGPIAPSEPVAPQGPDTAGPAGSEDSLARAPMIGAKPQGNPTAGTAKAQVRRPEGRLSSGVEGRKLVVGREICLSGEIKTCEKLVVEGRVEADLSDSQSLEITEPGFYRGNATVEDCEVSGTFEGELTVTGSLVIHPTGRVSGKIRYADLMVARGAQLRGDIDTLDPAAQRPARGEGPKLAHASGPEGAATPGAAKSHIG